ncbi:N-acetylglucosaminyl-phosphatidylinositol de-n-acetylase [Plakobranchus ocellatus]|uniref:N-acetylglucosaminylphosphatidylinositol deacetylase n=1 Tax=Plakobranchus ocellatus TaxID=259542 RepID=A0AAV3ZME4_9GAST|nr:N-acetylglucosaminyl-phosphatidylinositol de-n-acetylase [Plakobranchus ocellatus]
MLSARSWSGRGGALRTKAKERVVGLGNGGSRKNFCKSRNRILILTAHPDDECMFLSPAVISLCKQNEIFVLCATTGDYYKKGAVRQTELIEGCKILGVPEANVEILDNSAFPDDPHAVWDLVNLGGHVRKIINKFKPTYVFTFDDIGITGHPNHISVSVMSRQLAQAKGFSHGEVKFFELESVSLPRKYISFLDLPFNMGSNHLTFVLSVTDILRAQRAMCAHRSQMVWFRALYIIFSRYMVINTFCEVPT